MNFSVCLIAKNEEKTLPRMLGSLGEFRAQGGEVILLDTGSTDETVEIARAWGCTVHQVGNQFVRTIGPIQAHKINERFNMDEEAIAKAGDGVFDYSAARNHVASLASNDMIAMPDCDEAYTTLNLEEIEKAIKQGVERFEYNFVFSHDEFGNEAIKFVHSKFYDRRKARWVGIIHEVLQGKTKNQFVNEDIIKLEHFQNRESDRSRYLAGLALDCSLHPDNDRNSHYFGRELLWSGRPKSAIKELKRHVAMKKWPAERAQSMIYIGDAFGQLNEPEKQVGWYGRAFYEDSTRREALMKLARFYEHNNNPQAAAAFAAGALEVPYAPYYGNDMAQYTYEPHEVLYRANGWLGNIEGAKHHLAEALKYLPFKSEYLRDLRFYFDLPLVSFVIPTLNREEGLQRCIQSIENLNYPQDKIEKMVLPGEGTVPEKVKKGYEWAKGQYIVYASDDIEFEPDSLILALRHEEGRPGLVAFNTGEVLPDEGNICEHFLIKRSFAEQIGEIFDTDFHHVGVDNLLWAKAKKAGEASRCNEAVVKHHHFSRGAKMDSTYEKGWSKVEEDRELLKKKLALI